MRSPVADGLRRLSGRERSSLRKTPITSATTTIGSATRNISLIASLNAPVTSLCIESGSALIASTSFATSPSPSAGSPPRGAPAAASARCTASRLERTAPKSAAPNEPPICRKNCTELVATPISVRATEFCTAITSTCMVKPSAPDVRGTMVIFCTGALFVCKAATSAWPTSW